MRRSQLEKEKQKKRKRRNKTNADISLVCAGHLAPRFLIHLRSIFALG
jgi:hypothetical protein